MYVSQERLSQLSIAVLLMYVMIFANGVKSIVGCNIRHALSNNYLVQHLTAFLILLFFIVITTKETDQGGFSKNFVFSIVVYLWFAMLTRIRVEMFLFVLVLLLTAYALGKNNRDAPESNTKNTKNEYYQAILAGLAAFITIASFLHFTYTNMAKHGESFDWQTFIMKPPKCRQCKMSATGKCV